MFLEKLKSLIPGTPKTVGGDECPTCGTVFIQDSTTPAPTAAPVADVSPYDGENTIDTIDLTPLPPPPTFRPLTTLDAALAPAPSTLDAAVSQPSSHADLIEIRVNGIDEAKKNAVWLTKGQDRTQPATAVKLVDCTSDHLRNIVANKPGLSVGYRRIIEAILEDRGEALDDSDDAYTL
jgi:hypothetical protein